MRKIAALLSILGLILTVAPSVMVFAGRLEWSAHAHLMFAGMLLWFIFAPLWMRERNHR